MMAPATKIYETEKAEQLIVLSYEGMPKTIWVPKKIIKKKRQTIDGKRGVLYVLPTRFSKGHGIPNEVFIMAPDEFCETVNEMLPDIRPNLEHVIMRFKQSVRAPEAIEKIIRNGFVPLKKGVTIYFVPSAHIEEYYPSTRSWKILANTDFVKADGKASRPYKSFTFVVNGEVWVWDNGKIIPPENFITPDDVFEG